MFKVFNKITFQQLILSLSIIVLFSSSIKDNTITITTDKLIYFSADTIKITINNNTSDTLYGNISNELYNDSSTYTYLFDITNPQSHLKIKIEPDTFLPHTSVIISVKAGETKPYNLPYMSEKLHLRSAFKFGTILAESEKFTVLNDW
ncbi:MAG: hypothetical protein V4613_06280 [Bacteroidota bacterium]